MNDGTIKATYYLVEQVNLYLSSKTIRPTLIGATERVKKLLDNLTNE